MVAIEEADEDLVHLEVVEEVASEEDVEVLVEVLIVDHLLRY